MPGNATLTLEAEVARFAAAEIRPFATHFEEISGIPRQLITRMGEIGLLGAVLPPAYGGLGLDCLAYGKMTELIGKACCATRSVLTVHASLVGETILRFGTEEQKTHWLPLIASGEKIGAFALTEPEHGSDAAGIQTSYRKSGSDYLIRGQKKWISLGGIADFFIVLATSNGHITAFITERDHTVTTVPMTGLLGNRAGHVAEITFTDTRVTPEHILGREGNGFTHIVNAAMDYGRYSIAWAGQAIAQEALDNMVSYARTRSQFGQKLGQLAAIQQLIATATVKVHAGRNLCLKAGQARQQRDPDATMETIIAKYYTSKAAMEIATDAVQLFGGNGCYNVYPVERLFREAKILEIIEGTSQVMEGIIAGFALKKYYIPST